MLIASDALAARPLLAWMIRRHLFCANPDSALTLVPIMKAIIIAAGRGSRLEHHTDERPKCMVNVGGRSILDYQLAALAAHGIDDIHIIRGYLASRLTVDGATYHANPQWEDNNILQSLFCAQPAMDGGFLSTYSDIVYSEDAVGAALDGPGDITLVVDRQWQKAYQGRTDHPVTQAELVRVDGDRVVAVGKQVPASGAVGEFIGLAAHSAQGAQWMRQEFSKLEQRYDNSDIFRHGRTFQKAYLADFYEALIDAGIPVHWTPIDGGWREIDTVQDLQAVNAALANPSAIDLI